jgi:DNA-binding HxlR family transcriptional regulator
LRKGDVLERVAHPWSMRVLCTLGRKGTLRFSALKASIEDISLRALVQTLRKLEHDGFLSRTAHPTNPPCVDYGLTRLGKSLLVPVLELACWAKQNHRRVVEARSHHVPS